MLKCNPQSSTIMNPPSKNVLHVKPRKQFWYYIYTGFGRGLVGAIEGAQQCWSIGKYWTCFWAHIHSVEAMKSCNKYVIPCLDVLEPACC